MSENADQEYRDFQDAAGLPFLFGIPETVKAMQALVKYGAARRRGIIDLPVAAGEVQNVSDEDLVKVLADRGLTSPLQSIETKPAAARLAAEKIGFPVALKVISDEISHKTEAGGIVLNLLDGIAVENAANELQEKQSLDSHARL